MASVGGRKARVMYGTYTIAGIGEFSLSGLNATLLDDTAFGDTVMKFKREGIDNAGTVTFSGLYDPEDTNGQVALNALSMSTEGLTNLYFYELYNHPTRGYAFWRVQSGGKIFLQKFNSLKMGKNMLGTVEFTGQISDMPLERIA